MDKEETLSLAQKLTEQVGPLGEDIFLLGRYHEKSVIFSRLRDAIGQKDLDGDQVAVEVLSWIWNILSE